MHTRVLAALALILAATLVGPTAQAGDGAPDEPGWCTDRLWGPPREIPHAKRQLRVVDRVLGADTTGYDVKRASATHFGVVALVTGDVAKATRELRGVDHVVSWTRNFLSDFPPGMRMAVVLQRFLAPVLREVTRAVRGIPGQVEPAYWTEGGAVVLTWKAPAPAEVQALAGVRPGGAEVRVVERPYSWVDLKHAMRDLMDFLDERDVEMSTLGACRSDRGLELSVPFDVDELPVTWEELETAAGMPVLVLEGYAYPV